MNKNMIVKLLLLIPLLTLLIYSAVTLQAFFKNIATWLPKGAENIMPTLWQGFNIALITLIILAILLIIDIATLPKY